MNYYGWIWIFVGAISLVIQYFIMKTAVKKAVEDVMDSYQPGHRTEKLLEDIYELLKAQQPLDIEMADKQIMEHYKEVAATMHGESGAGEHMLLPVADPRVTDRGRCSACGEVQNKSRMACFKCGVHFIVNQPESQLVTTEK